MEMKVFIGNKVDTATKRYMEDHDVDDYSVAMRAVLDADPLLKSQYTGAPVEKAPKASLTTVSAYTQRQAGQKIHELVSELMAKEETLCSYSEALKMVLKAHPDLARRYACE